MENRELIKELPVGPYVLKLLMQGNVPLVEKNGQLYHHVWLLAIQMPIISDPAYIRQFAEVSNFLWKGLQFQFIEEIDAYQRFYLDQVEMEKKCSGDLFRYRLTDFKIFDVAFMHEPLIEDGQLLYFVYNTSTGLPYRVVCPFPYTKSSTLVHYQVLPLKSEAAF